MRECDAPRLGPFAHGLHVDHHQRGDVLAPVGDDDALLDEGAGLHGVLDLGGREVLAAGGDHDVLQAVHDLDLALLLAHHVARVQPAVDDALRRGLGVLVVAGEHHVAADLEFAVVGNAVLHARGHGAHGADDHVVEPVAGDHAGGFGQAVDLDQRHPQGAEEAHHVGRDGRGAGERDLGRAQADEVLQRAQHQPVVRAMAQALGQGPLVARLLGQRGAGGQGLLVQRAAQLSGLLHLDGDGRVQLFPDARHAQEHAGCHFAQVLLHGTYGFAEVDRGTQVQGHEGGEHLLGHVAQGQVGQVGGLRPEFQPLHDAGHHAADVAVGDHGALGLARGARGVDHQADVVQALARQAGVDACRIVLLAAQCLDFIEGGDQGALRGREAAQALGFHDDDFLQVRELVQCGQHLVGLLLVLADHDVDVGVAHHVGHLGRGAGGVDAHGDAAHQACAHLRQHPFDAVLGDHAHVAARGQAQLQQTLAEMRGALVVLRPGEGLPDAEVLLPDGDARSVLACALAQHLGQGEFGEIHDSHLLRRL